jgi:exonuclease SbcC
MLESLLIIDFQKHERIKIELDPLVTVISGKTDSGKSSIVRSLRWLSLNKPNGDSFIRWGASQSKIILKVDGRKITRGKGQANYYALDQDKFYAFGMSKVPEEIEEVLKLSDLNFQSQLDAPHLFSSSPGEVARHLNSIVNLEVMDRTLSLIASDLKKAKTSREIAQDRLQKAEEEEKALSWVPDANKALKALEKQEKALEAKRDQIASLETLLTRARTIEQEAKRGIPLSAIKHLDKLKSKADSSKQKKEELERLLDSLKRAEQCFNDSRREAEDLESQLAQVKTCPVCSNPLN